MTSPIVRGGIAALLISTAAAAQPEPPRIARPVLGRAPVVDSAGSAPYCTDGSNNQVACSDVFYYTHRVLSNPLVWVIFWTGSVDSATVQQIGGFYQAVTNSEIYDWIIEYDTEFYGSSGSNQRIGRGVYGGAYTIAPGTSATALGDADIQNELEAQINAGHIPPPDDNTIYMVYFPSGYTITQSNGDASCSKFCAYHGAFLHGSQDVFYGVFPDLSSGGCQFGCGIQSTVFKNLCSASTHELLEATTDAEVSLQSCTILPPSCSPSLAWYAKPYGGEIGDMCNQYADTISSVVDGTSYTVQQVYSQNTKLCQTSYSFVNDYRLYANPALVVAGPGQTAVVPIRSQVTAGSPGSHTLSLAGSLTGVTPSFDATTLAGNDLTYLRLAVDGSATLNSEVEYVVTAEQVGGSTLYTSRTAGVMIRIEAPPTAVTLSGVTDGGTVTGLVPLIASATAAASSTLYYVAIYIDGQLAHYAAPSVSYSWDVSGLDNGTVHVVRVVAVDYDGGNAELAATVTVANPPTVHITAPAGGATVSGPVAVSASAAAPPGTSIAALEVDIDGVAAASGASSPQAFSWDTTKVANGSHSVSASVTDADTTAAIATPVTVTVKNPPVVSIAPADGAKVKGSVPASVTASAALGSSLTGLVLKIDGAQVASGSTSPLSFAWDTTALANGSQHTLSATATDADSTTASGSATVTVRNPPTVAITAPAGGASVSQTASVTATAAAPAGTTLSGVALMLDGAQIATATASPAHFSWDTTTATNGSHTLTAVATDADGVAATSAAVAVTVANAAHDFTIALSPASATVTAGGAAATFTVSTTAVNGADSIALSVSGLPAGVTGSLAPTSVTAGASATLSVEAPAGAAAAAGVAFAVKGTTAAVPAGHSAAGSLTVEVPASPDAGTPDAGSGGGSTGSHGCASGGSFGLAALLGLLPLARRRRLASA